ERDFALPVFVKQFIQPGLQIIWHVVVDDLLRGRLGSQKIGNLIKNTAGRYALHVTSPLLFTYIVALIVNPRRDRPLPLLPVEPRPRGAHRRCVLPSGAQLRWHRGLRVPPESAGVRVRCFPPHHDPDWQSRAPSESAQTNDPSLLSGFRCR